jgi:hypothetical protein
VADASSARGFAAIVLRGRSGTRPDSDRVAGDAEDVPRVEPASGGMFRDRHAKLPHEFVGAGVLHEMMCQQSGGLVPITATFAPSAEMFDEFAKIDLVRSE